MSAVGTCSTTLIHKNHSRILVFVLPALVNPGLHVHANRVHITRQCERCKQCGTPSCLLNADASLQYVQSTPCPEPPFPIGGQTAAAPHDPEGASMIGRALERAGPPRHSSEAFAAQLADPSAKSISLPSHEQDLADSQGVASAFGPAAANAVRVLPSIVPSSQSQISEATAVNTEQGQAPAFGHVPKASMPSATAQSRINPKLVREVPLSGPLHPYLLYCNKCEIVKPPRTHHCRRCGTCVLNMVGGSRLGEMPIPTSFAGPPLSLGGWLRRCS